MYPRLTPAPPKLRPYGAIEIRLLLLLLLTAILDTTLLMSPANFQQNYLLLISLLSILSQVYCCLFLGLHFRSC